MLTFELGSVLTLGLGPVLGLQRFTRRLRTEWQSARCIRVRVKASVNVRVRASIRVSASV